MAQQSGNHARAIELEERALAVEHEHLPQLVNLQAFRQRYNWLWQQYQSQIGEAAAAKDDATVSLWLKRAEAAWLRWFEIDHSNPQMVQQMATLQMTAGREADAWLFLSTIIDQRPRDAESYHAIGQWHRGRNELDETQQWFARAYKWDTANPRWLMERAQVLDELGRKDDARGVYRQIVAGKWAPGLQRYVEQAKQALNQ